MVVPVSVACSFCSCSFFHSVICLFDSGPLRCTVTAPHSSFLLVVLHTSTITTSTSTRTASTTNPTTATGVPVPFVTTIQLSFILASFSSAVSPARSLPFSFTNTQPIRHRQSPFTSTTPLQSPSSSSCHSHHHSAQTVIMASSPPSLDHSSLFISRRPSYTSDNPYAPPMPSPLSPFTISSTPPTATAAAAETPLPITLPMNSHYYRPPRSSLTSPTRSNISSPTGSPTRTSRQTRIQSLLATDPLLSRLTPLTISRLSNDPDFAFSTAEKEWSLRAAEGIIKVGEWLREVEGWNLNWRKAGGGKGKENGVGYLPPSQDRPKKRRKISGDGKGEMRSIKEEAEEEEEEEGESELRGGKKRSVRRKLFVDRSTDTSDSEEKPAREKVNGALKTSEVDLKPPPAEEQNVRQPRKPLTPYQLRLQRQRAEASVEDTSVKEAPISTPVLAKRLVEPPSKKEEEAESSEEEDDDDAEYWGSLKKETIVHYLERIEQIRSEVEELDVEALKSKVLCMLIHTVPVKHPLNTEFPILTHPSIPYRYRQPTHRLLRHHNRNYTPTPPSSPPPHQTSLHLGCSSRRSPYCPRLPAMAANRQRRPRRWIRSD